MLFEEDDHGDHYFVITNGEVRISKFIPDIGEEALAVRKPWLYQEDFNAFSIVRAGAEWYSDTTAVTTLF